MIYITNVIKEFVPFEDLIKKTKDIELGNSIVEKYGYFYKGFYEMPGTKKTAVIIGRNDTGIDENEYKSIISHLTEEGFSIVDIFPSKGYDGKQGPLIYGKSYDSGGIAVMEHQDITTRQPLGLTYSDKEGYVMFGIPIYYSPEHIDDIIEISEALGMEPILKIPDVFEKAFDDSL